MVVDLIKTFYVEAAHRLPGREPRVARIHGHSYRIDLVLQGEIDEAMGWLVDFGEIKRVFQPYYERLDHHFLNDVPGLEDTSLVGFRTWLLTELRPHLPWLKDVHVTLSGDGEFAPKRRDADLMLGLPPRWRFSFESAHYLPMVPPGHKCRRLHGHTWRAEAGAADLEGLLEPLSDLYGILDHQNLNEIDGLANATSENLSRWIWNYLRRRVDDTAVVVIQETCTARCIYHGE